MINAWLYYDSFQISVYCMIYPAKGLVGKFVPVRLGYAAWRAGTTSAG